MEEARKPRARPDAQAIKLESDGSFIAIHGAADFDYSARDKTLKVMRVLSRGSVRPSREDAPGIVLMRRLGQLEPWTMGGGEFYINPHPWIDSVEKVEDPNMNTFTLMRMFTDDGIDPVRFVTDVRWLVYWAEYWGPRIQPVAGTTESGMDRAFRTPEEQAATRPALERWAQEILAQPEPPRESVPF